MKKIRNVLKNGACDNCGKQAKVKARTGKGNWKKIFLCSTCRKDLTL